MERLGPLPADRSGGRDPELSQRRPSGGPLEGVEVLDIGMWRPAPFAAQLLAELSANVVRIEPPAGDPMRAFPSLYEVLNRHKRVVHCDLKTDDGLARALELAERADVVLEGFRPGVAERLGIGPAAIERINPRAIYCSISGFGQDGPWVQAPGHDLNYQAMTGVLAARAPELHRAGVPIGDLAGGVYAAFAICAALVGRARTGDGERIDVGMADVLLSWTGTEPGGDLASSSEPGTSFPAYGTFECARGEHLVLGVVTEDRFWAATCAVLGLDDAAALDVAGRAARSAELGGRIADELRTRERDEVVAALVAAGVPASPVLSAAEALRLEHFVARGTSVRSDDGTYGLGHPVKFERHPPLGGAPTG